MISLLFCIDGSIVVKDEKEYNYDLLYVVNYDELLLYCALNQDNIPDTKERFYEIKEVIVKEYYDFILDCFNSKAQDLIVKMKVSKSNEQLRNIFESLEYVEQMFLKEKYNMFNDSLQSQLERINIEISEVMQEINFLSGDLEIFNVGENFNLAKTQLHECRVQLNKLYVQKQKIKGLMGEK